MKTCKAEGLALRRISRETRQRLQEYSWPGNVRELENTIERTLTLTPDRSQIEVSDLPKEMQHGGEPLLDVDVELPDEGIDLVAYLHHIERELIRRSLERTGGNKHKAAKLLNIKRTTLVEKAKRLEL